MFLSVPRFRAALAFLGGIGLSFSTSAQNAELLESYSQSQLALTAAVFGIPNDTFSADYDVNAYRVTYEMPYLEDTIVVSGALFTKNAVLDKHYPCLVIFIDIPHICIMY